MTTLWGDTGKMKDGSLKTFTITPTTPKETFLGASKLTLPTTEPGTAQASFTIEESDLPNISPNVPYKLAVSVVCSGKTGASTTQVNYRVIKNGVTSAQASQNNVPANNFWTHTYFLLDLQVGDVVEVKLWSNQVDAYIDFYGMVCSPSQPECSKKGTILKDLGFPAVSTNSSPFTSTTLGTINVTSSLVYPATNIAFSDNVATTLNYPAIIPNTSYGLYRLGAGDNSTTNSLQANATNRNMQKSTYPTAITFREVLR